MHSCNLHSFLKANETTIPYGFLLGMFQEIFMQEISPFPCPLTMTLFFLSPDLTILVLLQIFPTAAEDEYILGESGFVSIV